MARRAKTHQPKRRPDDGFGQGSTTYESVEALEAALAARTPDDFNSFADFREWRNNVAASSPEDVE